MEQQIREGPQGNRGGGLTVEVLYWSNGAVVWVPQGPGFRITYKYFRSRLFEGAMEF